MQSPEPPIRRRDHDSVALATLAGVVAILVISYANMRDIARIDRGLGELEDQVAQVATGPAQPAPAQQGPDPNRVVTVRMSADTPVRGPANAPVTIAEFSDFQCPFCERATPTLKQVLDVYKDKVRIVWKHLPLESIHPNAMGAALAAEAARGQGKFWEYHDKLFANQGKLQPNDLTRYASELGLDMARFDKDLANPENRKRVTDDIAEARSLGVNGTPGFFINGRFSNGARPFADFAKAIDEELGRLNLPVPEKPAAD